MVNSLQPLYSVDHTGGGTSTINGSHNISSMTLINAHNDSDTTSDNLVLLSIDRTNGLDINEPTIHQAPGAYDHTLMIVNNKSHPLFLIGHQADCIVSCQTTVRGNIYNNTNNHVAVTFADIAAFPAMR